MPCFSGLLSQDFQLTSAVSLVCAAFETQPRRVLAATAALCVGLLAFGLYLQHVVGLEPCPMCIVQRYALVLVAVVAAVGAAWNPDRGGLRGVAGLLLVLAGSGAFVAARQSWLQWYPPEIATCGRDFYGMIETFPLQRVIPMIFKGSGDCTAIDWTFLSLSIANWSFLNFCLIAAVALGLVLGTRARR
jgi:disulfide bond formation protein DsbB